MERLPVRRHVRRLAPLALVAALLASLPGLSGVPALAQTTITQALDDTQVDFASGVFQRTAVSAGTVPDPKPFPDSDGTLELASAGNLKRWTPTFPSLPIPLAGMGVTTIGPRLYVIGGATTGDNAFSDTAYWVNLNQQTGGLDAHGMATPPQGGTIINENWVNDPLPAVSAFMGTSPQNTSGCDAQQITSRTGPAVASFATGTGADYLYVIGGTLLLGSRCGSGSVSSPAVQRGSVTGNEIAWTGQNQLVTSYLPSPDFPGINGEDWDTANDGVSPPPALLNQEALGVTGATASVVTTAAGRTFLYVIGGLVSFVSEFQGRDSLVTPAVFYTRLNSQTGAFENPNDPPGTAPTGTPWLRTANVPLNEVQTDQTNVPLPGNLGIYNHTAMVSQGLEGAGTAAKVNSAIYVTGGYVNRPDPNNPSVAQATVFRATVNDLTGALSWSATPNATNTTGSTIGQGRAGLGGFAFGNKLYILGGTPRSDTASDAIEPVGTASVGAHDDRLNLLNLFGTAGTPVYFSSGPTQVIDAAYDIAAAVIPALPPPNVTTIDGSGWGYAIGGIDGANVFTRQIFRGRIGGSAEAEQTTRIPDGWYYSRLFNIRFETENTEARILSIRWGAGLNRQLNPGADLRIEFQRTRNLPCNEAAFAGSQWVPLDSTSDTDTFSSQDGFNEVKLRDIFPTEDFLASCFRYRVFMTQNGTTAGSPNPPGPGGATVSPQLFNVSVEKIQPGDPDLKLDRFNIGTDDSGRISTFDLAITNLNDNLQNTVAVTGGQFPVVICVAYAALDQPPPTLTPPTLPLSLAADLDDRVDCAPIYRWVDPSETLPGQVFTLNNNWRVNFPYPTSPHLPEGLSADDLLGKGTTDVGDPKLAFAKEGRYAVAVLLDPFGLKAESAAARANNRGENINGGQPLIRTFTVTVPGFDRTVRLPFVTR